MKSEFPENNNAYLKPENFQDNEISLTFKGWDKKANEDREIKGVVQTWKNNLKYCLRYSYPEYAIDESGEKILDKNGKPFRNKNYDPAYPHGYSIVYHFEEGVLECGSLPLFNAFCMVRPKIGESVLISRTGKDKETKWSVKKIAKEALRSSYDEPTIQLDEE